MRQRIRFVRIGGGLLLNVCLSKIRKLEIYLAVSLQDRSGLRLASQLNWTTRVLIAWLEVISEFHATAMRDLLQVVGVRATAAALV